MLQFASGLTKNKAAFSQISASFKDAGEEGARTVSTIIQLGQKSDFFREKIELGKESIKGTSAITDAFALKNENLGAEVDKGRAQQVEPGREKVGRANAGLLFQQHQLLV